jgi:hypothetical protein
MNVDKTLRHDKRKITLIILGALIALLTITYAYYVAQTGNGAFTNLKVTSGTVDRLTFINGSALSLKVDQFTLAEGSTDNVTGSTSSSANLKANSSTITATDSYNAYFDISQNEFTYTSGTTPEMLLSITDPSGTLITSIPNLTYVTQNGVSGFDITNKIGTFTIASGYSITSNNATTGYTQTWNATVTFLNLATDQTANEGKSFISNLILQKGVYLGDVRYAVATDGTNGLAKSISDGGYDAAINCSVGNAVWSNKYWGVIADLSSSTIGRCNLTYTTKVSKTYLNTMVTGLNGQTTGTGQVVHETFIGPTVDATYSTQSMTQVTTDGTDMTVSDNQFIGAQTTAQTSSTHKFYPTSNGYYRVCYSLPSSAYTAYNSNNLNQIRYYDVNSTSSAHIIYSSYNNGSVVTSCIIEGYMTTSDFVQITNYYYDQNITVYFQKTSNTQDYDAGYRYEGKEPNNYVWFNNELWRVIGVFDTTLADGTTTQSLTKIIRADIIGSLAWDKANTNDWSTSSLKNLLNGAYLNKQDGTSSGYCYGYSNNLSMSCDYTEVGINDNYRSMIKNITWKLGGISTNSADNNNYKSPVNNYYVFERGTTVYSGRPTSTTGFIGLMYLSDYGYSVLASSCARTTNLYLYNSDTCGGQSWLYGQGYEWTMSPNSSGTNNEWIWDYNGSLYNRNAYDGYGVSPVLYLDSSVFVSGGTGTITDPYTLGM